MRVVNRGTLTENQLCEVKCPTCKSDLEFTKSEAKPVSDRNEVCYTIVCPVCSKDIWMTRLKPKNI